MSIIGPRPWIPEYYKNFNEFQKKRNDVRPGIIGLAQVNGRNNLSIFEKLDYDIKYVNEISFVLDLKILFKSISTIIAKEDGFNPDENISNEISDLKKSNK